MQQVIKKFKITRYPVVVCMIVELLEYFIQKFVNGLASLCFSHSEPTTVIGLPSLSHTFFLHLLVAIRQKELDGGDAQA